MALVGGGEWQAGCSFDRDLLARSEGDQVLVLPTAAAYEHPERSVARAGEWFEGMDAHVEGLMVLSRPDAEDAGMAAVMRKARFVYLSGGSPMHLRSVLKGSAVWSALLDAWNNGAVIAGTAEAAMALTDPMVDARGGGLTLGLGLLQRLAVVPHFGDTMRMPRREAAPVGGPGRRPASRLPASRSAPLSSGNRTARGGAQARDRWSSTSTGPARRRGWTHCPGSGCRAVRVQCRRCSPVEARRVARRREPERVPWSGRLGQSASVMVTDSMVTFSTGFPTGCRSPRWPATTSRPSTTLPNSE